MAIFETMGNLANRTKCTELINDYFGTDVRDRQWSVMCRATVSLQFVKCHDWDLLQQQRLVKPDVDDADGQSDYSFSFKFLIDDSKSIFEINVMTSYNSL